jgi:amino acid transporter
MVAWSLSLLYLFATMSSLVISAKQIIGLATYFHPTYVPKPVHIWAVNVAFGLLCAIINLFAIRYVTSSITIL